MFFFLTQENFVAKNTENFSESTFQIAQKILNWIPDFPNSQSNRYKFHSESITVKNQMITLLDILKSNVIEF